MSGEPTANVMTCCWSAGHRRNEGNAENVVDLVDDVVAMGLSHRRVSRESFGRSAKLEARWRDHQDRTSTGPAPVHPYLNQDSRRHRNAEQRFSVSANIIAAARKRHRDGSKPFVR